ncbi:monovalent cation:H+ antiporter, CPA1 family [Bathymodiolus platifrons methanotrophic gill symbiont]|nr:sodium:proton exchanger [Methylococcaceae bacterium CS4]TXK98466.1 sodium:proton exchanger [Methylococcaceae bacterium CS5]TXL04205.1 sodium:proton exchanger [Methylococcaceae bacterium CS3]TXL07325.1 sodium:proton exchanger [Methylococcaceae bacterium CS1]TXL11142.1 sodium:proton exchanger [Methylococcaceae bacterium CS2]GAW86834.1 monovalent cation:H+ antiporter, CPA1 family [Bathymodiolus platifrons methanotrophic gill symbiont]
MTLDVYLSVFTLMLFSLGINIISLKMRIPYTVLLVIGGSLLVPLSKIEALSFVTSFQLTPELLFFVFLPILIFESAYNIKIRNIKENKFAISMLAIVGLLISTFFIGFVGRWAFQLLGFDIPLLVTLLFGAIISATDPVAVLSLFKEFGAPRRLTLIFEGESLFNDGTAFAIFLVFLEIMLYGFNGVTTVMQGLFSFFTMIIGGGLFGLLMGFFFSKLIEWVKGHEHLEITLTLLVAHFTFLLAELISEKLVISGHHLQISSIIATLVSSIVMGNFGRFKMSVGVEEYMEKFWSYFAFLANSLVFILMGLLFTSLSISINVAILPILIMILVVNVARAVSIYGSIGIANQIKSEESIPLNWQHLLSWGSLRGAIAVVMVMLIPDDLSLPNWDYDFSIKEFITAITIGSIYFTLLVKATTIGKVIRWLKIDALLPHEQMSYFKSKALIYQSLNARVKELYEHRDISEAQYKTLTGKHQTLYLLICQQCNEKTKDPSHVVENMLRIYTLALQKIELKEIFRRGEINENIYKKNLLILETQTERVEQDRPQLKSLNAYLDSWLGKFKRFFLSSTSLSETQELYLYYRTQYKLINKVISDLALIKNSPLIEIFDDPKAFQNVENIYQYLKNKTVQQMAEEIQSNKDLVDDMNEQSAKALLDITQADTLKDLHKHEIISSKLYLLLKNEIIAGTPQALNSDASSKR